MSQKQMNHYIYRPGYNFIWACLMLFSFSAFSQTIDTDFSIVRSRGGEPAEVEAGGFFISTNQVVMSRHMLIYAADENKPFFILFPKLNQQFPILTVVDVPEEDIVIVTVDLPEKIAAKIQPLIISDINPKSADEIYLLSKKDVTDGLNRIQGKINGKVVINDWGYVNGYSIDLLASKGNSGDPIFNADNQVIGILSDVRTPIFKRDVMTLISHISERLDEKGIDLQSWRSNYAKSAEHFYSTGVLASQAGQWIHAQVILEYADELNEDPTLNLFIKTRLMEAYNARKMFDRSIDIGKVLENQYPNDLMIKYCISDAYFRKGSPEYLESFYIAREYALKFLESEQRMARPYLIVGLSYVWEALSQLRENNNDYGNLANKGIEYLKQAESMENQLSTDLKSATYLMMAAAYGITDRMEEAQAYEAKSKNLKN